MEQRHPPSSGFFQAVFPTSSSHHYTYGPTGVLEASAWTFCGTLRVMIEAKHVSAVFYRTEDGAEPVRAWLKSMAKEARFKIGVDIKAVEFGWPMGMPHCRPLGNGLHEVRTNLQNRTARVLFFVADDHMVLVHGFVKKTRAMSRADMALALDRKRKWESCT